MAEWIRMLGDYAPFKLSRLSELSSIPESLVSSDPEEMAEDLLKDHEASVVAFANASIAAANIGQKGLENFLADCMATHQKWAWQLRVSGIEVEMDEEPEVEATEPMGSTAPSEG